MRLLLAAILLSTGLGSSSPPVGAVTGHPVQQPEHGRRGGRGTVELGQAHQRDPGPAGDHPSLTSSRSPAPGPRASVSPPKPGGTPRPRVQEVRVGRVLVQGRASWHGTGRDGLYAAAGPALRSALGSWRGQRVKVSVGGRSVIVRLNDFCPCNTGSPPKVIDLSDEAFRRLAPLSRGVLKVTIRIVK